MRCGARPGGTVPCVGSKHPPKKRTRVYPKNVHQPWPLALKYSKVKNMDDVTWHLSAWFPFSKMALDTLKANRSGGDFSEVTFFAPLLSLQLPILTRAALVFTLRRFLLLVLTEATVAQVLMVVVQV